MTLSPIAFVASVLIATPLMMLSWPVTLGSIAAAAFRPTGKLVVLMGLVIGSLHGIAHQLFFGKVGLEALGIFLFSSQLASIILVGGVSWMLRKFWPRQKPAKKDAT